MSNFFDINNPMKKRLDRKINNNTIKLEPLDDLNGSISYHNPHLKTKSQN